MQSMVILDQSQPRHKYISVSVFLPTQLHSTKKLCDLNVQKVVQFKLLSFSTFSTIGGQPKVVEITGIPLGLWGTILYGVLDMLVVGLVLQKRPPC